MDSIVSQYMMRIPDWVFLLSFLILSSIIVLSFSLDRQLAKKIIVSSLLVDYYLLVLCSTVFFRRVGVTRLIELIPYWNWSNIVNDFPNARREVVMNILMFMPIGLLLGGIIKRRSWLYITLFSIVFSCIIEILQYLLQRGCCEMNDLIHNVLGAIMGYGLYRLLILLLRYTKKE